MPDFVLRTMRDPFFSQTLLPIIAGLFSILAIIALCANAWARDAGQWENSDPRIREWYRSLMRPDAPNNSCCDIADAYWADKVVTRDGKVYATITDDRPDGPLGRPHIPPGTEFEIPPEKLKWDRGNPTGHNILFVSPHGMVYCFVQGSGT
jgi:hypothetical protein